MALCVDVPHEAKTSPLRGADPERLVLVEAGVEVADEELVGDVRFVGQKAGARNPSARSTMTPSRTQSLGIESEPALLDEL